MKNRRTFINTELNQEMVVEYDGYHFQVVRNDSNGYSTRLTLKEEQCIKFVQQLLQYGWEQTDGRNSFHTSDAEG